MNRQAPVAMLGLSILIAGCAIGEDRFAVLNFDEVEVERVRVYELPGGLR